MAKLLNNTDSTKAHKRFCLVPRVIIAEMVYLCRRIQILSMSESLHIAIIGGGASGFFAAITAKETYPSSEVCIFEKNAKMLMKVGLTGGGRCNLTNSFRDVTDLKQVYPRGHKLMKRLFNQFDYADTMQWFEQRGVPLYVQDNQCVFPLSDDSQTIIDCLVTQARKLGVKLFSGYNLKRITPCENTSQYKLLFSTQQTSNVGKEDAMVEKEFDRVAFTMGGIPKVEGLKMFSSLGLNCQMPVPSLFSLVVADKEFCQLSGTAVAEAMISIPSTKFRVEGSLLITHWGMSGPAVLKLSSHAARYLSEQQYRCRVSINWIHQSNRGEVEELLRLFIMEHSKKQVSTINPFTLPSRLWHYLLIKAHLPLERKWAEVGKKSFNQLIEVITNDQYEITGRGMYKEEFVTCGGLSLSNINLNTLESKLHPHLYFAGELLDIDAVTGGFNLQAAWTTGYVVGKHIGDSDKE